MCNTALPYKLYIVFVVLVLILSFHECYIKAHVSIIEEVLNSLYTRFDKHNGDMSLKALYNPVEAAHQLTKTGPFVSEAAEPQRGCGT